MREPAQMSITERAWNDAVQRLASCNEKKRQRDTWPTRRTPASSLHRSRPASRWDCRHRSSSPTVATMYDKLSACRPRQAGELAVHHPSQLSGA